MLNDTGRYRELPCWRKPFKHEWKNLTNILITLPLNSKYRPDLKAWVCTCPYFVKSQFLVCKHLIQSIPTMPPTFFLEVTCHVMSECTALLGQISGFGGVSDSLPGYPWIYWICA